MKSKQIILKNPQEPTSIQVLELLMSKWIRNTPPEKLNNDLEKLVNVLYSILALNQDKKLTKDELSVLKGLISEAYRNISVDFIKKAFIWSIANDVDFTVYRVDFKTISQCIKAYTTFEQRNKKPHRAVLSIGKKLNKTELAEINKEFKESVLNRLKRGDNPRDTYAFQLYDEFKEKINISKNDAEILLRSETKRYNIYTNKRDKQLFLKDKTREGRIKNNCKSILVCKYLQKLEK